MRASVDDDEIVRKISSEASGFKILGRAKETALFIEYGSTKDERRRSEIKADIIRSNLRFVLNMAKDYNRITGLSIAEFYSEGKVGIVEAFNKFDYRSGVKFISFAVWEIRRHMAMIVQSSDIVRVSTKTRKRVLDARKNGTSVSGIKYGSLALQAIGEQMSLDSPTKTSDGTSESHITMGDVIPSADELLDIVHQRETVAKTVHDAMEYALTKDERHALVKMYGMDGYELTNQEYANECNLSIDRVRRIKRAAIDKLRNSSLLQEMNEEFQG